jgi:hypothetical protein
VKSFTSDCTIAFSFDNQNEINKAFNFSPPQESSVSPILFLILANAVLKTLENIPNLTAILRISYVYHVSLTVQNTNIDQITKALEIISRTVINLAQTIGLFFSSKKTKIIHFIYPNNLRTKSRITNY